MTSFQHRPARTWLKIMISGPQNISETISGYLAALTDSGTEIIDAESLNSITKRDLIIGYLLDDAQRKSKEKELHHFLNDIQKKSADNINLAVQTELITEEDWGKTWKEHFKPERITPHLTIKPTWEEYNPHPGEHVIEMDPGMAFGTGHHASTRLALSLIEELFSQETKPQSVLDVGTGTGILGMACCLLGAASVLAIDNDPDAVAAARENLTLNKLEKKMTADGRDITLLSDSYDLVIANIIHDTLIHLMPHIIDKTKKTGFIVLAGILKGEQEKNIIKSYENLGVGLVKAKYMDDKDEWVALTFKK